MLPLSNHLPCAWHYLSTLLPQAAPQGFILPRDGSFAFLSRQGCAWLKGGGGGAGGSACSAHLSHEFHHSALPSASIQPPWQHSLTCSESIFPIKLSE